MSGQTAFAQNEQTGKTLFNKLRCAECHSVNGEGGCLGPPLDGVMKRRDAAYVRMRLNKDDEAGFVKLIGHPELMPHPRFSKTEVASLAAYLTTLPERKMEITHHDVKEPPSNNAEQAPRHPDAASIAAGKKLFYRSACLACHSVGGTGGTTGPALDAVAERRSPQSIDAFIANPVSIKGSTLMPQAHLSSSQRRQIVDFLLSLSKRNK